MTTDTLDTEITTAISEAIEHGVGILPNVLTDREVREARADFDRAYLDLGKGPGEPGTRDSLWGELLLEYPGIAHCFSHPRIVSVVTGILEEPVPFLEKVKTNRYTPEHIGVGKHADMFGFEVVPAFSEVATQVFLDDISTGSGAVLYASGSHRLHFESDDDPGRKSPSREEIEAGEYVPAEVEAGSVIFRIPQVWHAVDPIHRLRRYVTGSYAARRNHLRAYQLDRILGCRKTHRESDLTLIPPHIQPLWHPDPWND